MTLATIIFFVLTGLAVIGCLGAVNTLLRHFRRQPREIHSLPGLSMMVPMKGTDKHTYANLSALITSQIGSPIQFILVMETEDDPAFTAACRIRDEHLEADVTVVLSGPAGGRMGKMHNLAAALPHTRHAVVGSVDADIALDADSLAACLATLVDDQLDAVCAVPYYAGSGPIGGAFVAAYTNYFFDVYMGAMAVLHMAPVLIGGLWMMRRDMLDQIGGLEPFTKFISDDAALGKAIAEHGGVIGIARKAVMTRQEQLDLSGGFTHLQKWVAMLRAEGLRAYLPVMGTWHMLWYAVLGLIAALTSGDGRLIEPSFTVLIGAMLVRAASVVVINKTIFAHLPRWRYILTTLLYEFVIAPPLFLIGLFKRNLMWRGRHYQVGQNGKLTAKD
jgi:cellulose synthase/poly-beta-1,6-N-acetylglucosamine synthase-like glycosyltransferase